MTVTVPTSTSTQLLSLLSSGKSKSKSCSICLYPHLNYVLSRNSVDRRSGWQSALECEKKSYMIDIRDEIVEKVFCNKDDDKIKMPVSIANSIANIQGQLSLSANSIVDITYYSIRSI